jgi:23S rRNA (pseudouridine1915-N3)-methyltransferase
MPYRVGLAQKIGDLALRGNSNLTFAIGGSDGLSRDVKQRADFSLSFPKMTFPHQLMRVTLLEQLCRAYTISNSRKYHK